MVNGIPLETKVKNSPRIELDIWKIPKPSAPSLRDKKILKKKPNVLVIIEKIVTTATALKIVFILVLYKLIYMVSNMNMTSFVKNCVKYIDK